MTFKELRERSGMNLAQFSRYFGINYRTVQRWEYGERNCPPYLLNLMEHKLTQSEPRECEVCKDIQHLHLFDDRLDAFISEQMTYCPHCGRKI